MFPFRFAKMNKKAIVTHPLSMFMIAVVIGAVLCILWIQGYVDVPYPFCKE